MNLSLNNGKICEGMIKILIFTEGTVTMHKVAVGVSREERVRQSKTGSVYDYSSYIPNGNAVQKLTNWKNQGATVYYLTSSRIKPEIKTIKSVLKKYNFPDSDNLHFRQQGEDYKDVAEKIMPDVLIEDDCESIGGEKEMVYPHIKPQVKEKMKSIIVKEFAGIDDLPNSLDALLVS